MFNFFLLKAYSTTHVTTSVSSTKCSSSSEWSIESQEVIEMNCTIFMYASIRDSAAAGAVCST